MQISCPHCRANVEIPNHVAGKPYPCGNCGNTINPISPSHASSAGGGSGKTILFVILGIVGVLMLLCCVGVFSMFFMVGSAGVSTLKTAQGAAQSAAVRTHCANNMKQLALALHTHHDVHRWMPAAVSTDDDGNVLHSWRTMLLPYVDELELYERIRLDEPWDSPYNQQFHSQMPAIYGCPANTNGNNTNYMLFTGEKSPWKTGETTQFRDIVDGTSNTIAFVEVNNSNINWMEPRDIPWDGTAPATGGMNQPGSAHDGGFHAAFMDGSVRFISDNISPDNLRKMIGNRDGEPVDPF